MLLKLHAVNLPFLPRLSLVLSQLPIVLIQGLNSLTNFLIMLFLVNAIGIDQFGVFSICYLVSLQISEATNALISAPMVSLGSAESSIEEIVSASSVLIAIALVLIAFLGALAAVNFDELSSLLYATTLLTSALVSTEFARRLLFLVCDQQSVWKLDFTRATLILTLFLLGPQAFSSASADLYLALLAISNLAALLLIAIHKINPVLYLFTLSNFRQLSFRIVRNGVWLTSTFLLYFLNESLVLILGSHILGSFVIGIVRMCQSVIGLVNPIYSSLEYIVPAMLGRAKQTHDKSLLLAIYKRYALCFLAVVFCALSVVGLLSGEILRVVAGTNLSSYTWIMQGICLWYFLKISSAMLSFPMRFFERTRSIFNSLLFAAVITLLIVLPSIELLSTAGLVLTLIVSQGAIAVYRVIDLQSHLRRISLA